MYDFRIPIYSVMILLALVANIVVVALISKKYSFTKEEIICLLLYENVGIIGGAKILTFLQNYKELNGQFVFLRLGFTAYGAIIGALLFLTFFSLQFKKSLKELLYIFMPSIPLMYGIGKIGCFLAGCCHGFDYNGLGSVIYNYSKSAPKYTPLFPIQIIETIFFIGIFIYMITKHSRNQFVLKTLGVSFVLCGFSKFILDFFRASHLYELSLNQIISIVFIVIGLVLIITKRCKTTP